MINDIFDNGTPKYSTAQDIYDGLCDMSTGEEIGILSEMFEDVSWEGQDYYYTDKGSDLKERFESTTDGANDMWKIDVAIAKFDGIDSNDMIMLAYENDDLGKRIGLKKIFIETICNGQTSCYDKISESFFSQAIEADRYDFETMNACMLSACHEAGFGFLSSMYRKFCEAVYRKIDGLHMEKEMALVAESRSLLTAYDDFMFGLKSNQALYQMQEKQYQSRIAELKAAYEQKLGALLSIAEKAGLLPEVQRELKMLESKKEA